MLFPGPDIVQKECRPFVFGMVSTFHGSYKADPCFWLKAVCGNLRFQITLWLIFFFIRSLGFLIFHFNSLPPMFNPDFLECFYSQLLNMKTVDDLGSTGKTPSGNQLHGACHIQGNLLYFYPSFF